MRDKRLLRLFIAIAVSDIQKKEIVKLQQRLKSNLQGLRSVKAENLHLTLKFFGDTGESMIDQIKGTMDEVSRETGRITLQYRGCGVFPSPLKARVIWTGVENGRDHLIALAGKLQNSLHGHGFFTDARTYSPHLTIGRFRENPPRHRIETLLTQENDFKSSSAVIENLTLFESRLQRGGALYIPLHKSPLGISTN